MIIFELINRAFTENLGLKPRPSCSVPMSEGTSDGAVRF
ncbi:hypothetical protein CWATWH8502_3603 [Crocosphaera watsonii WH 8502]|uniref:Uncharacterized protein n=5 Tax=Crocosphaera watsonii TaxID=263511 RepID=T2JP40_CROWT|nr:hypothetical protein CWATWH0003_3232 [Crocosphaera watsonii WH 0003]CCQ53408.1 hypothetical protein CWATWH8502_3603 [Crocosphaera watsonii WH 8502]CCQ55582.1 hypothetical protein CWATWH0005_3404 [Crocosphaera watsonii WH 0005]CCQ63676.1 hypothetical protein CWATWH0401_4983 [Crocosphaera watsonii WH 0401]CCQ66995.1 hypothetical protein CWATWH0402_4474 [Crocosphaera watsonii WH 0402]